ncbi:MAG TPA: prolipoprotein diacylglyceryl transferase family protein [Verrucomicrobiae bacterium]|nr:prolipoprotein diacylglyceryl transferase family protein [Verrucomicrobiae bacterium]
MTILDPHPVLALTRVGPITPHGVMFALGAVVAALWFGRQVARAGLFRFVEGVEKGVIIFIAGLFCARFGYLLTYRSEWVEMSQLFAVWQGGLVSFWGIVGGALVAWYSGRRFTAGQWVEWARAATLAALLGWAIGRIGNYYMGDSYGVPSQVWQAFYGRVPIQLFESLLCFALWFFLRRMEGMRAVWLAALGYFAGRLVIDTWRDEGVFGLLHVSQWVSLLVLLILAFSYVRTRPR